MAIYYEDQSESWKEEFLEVIINDLDPTNLFNKARHRK